MTGKIIDSNAGGCLISYCQSLFDYLPILNLASAVSTASVERYLEFWQRYQWQHGASK